MSENKDNHSGMWTREEAYDFLDTRYYMSEQTDEHNEKMIDDLCAMTHRPWCRTHMAEIAPNYGADCTCDHDDIFGSDS